MARRRLAATLSVLRIINLRAIRRHALRSLLAALSLGGGVAVVVAVMIETTSVSEAVDDVGYRIAGPAPLRIIGGSTRAGVDPPAIDAARTVAGVSATVPIIRAVTTVDDDGSESFVLALGIDCTAQWIVDPQVCRPGQAEPQIIATSVTFGSGLTPSATLATDLGRMAMPALQQVPELNTVNNGQVVVLPLSVADAQFARNDAVDILYVTLAEGADVATVREGLTRAVGPGYSVLTRDDPARGFDVNTLLFPLLAIFALVAVGVGVILIAQITRLSVEERRRDIAVAAALGASPVSTVTGFLAEAALLGAAGSILGVLLGIAIAHPVVAGAGELTQLFMGVHVDVVVRPHVVLAGFALGVLLAVAAAVLPSRSAANTAIATELSGRATHENNRSRAIWPRALALLAIGAAGVVCTRWATASGGLTLWQVTVANVGVVLAIVGLLSAAAYLSAQVIAWMRVRPDRARTTTLSIALTGLRADGSRTTAIAGAVAVPVVVAMLLSGFLVAINRGVEDVARAQADGRLVLTTTRFTDWGSIDAKFSPDTVAALRAVPGAATVERMAEIEANLDDGSQAYVRAEDRPAFPFEVLAGDPPEVSAATDRLVIGGILARDQGIGIGDTLRIGNGPDARAVPVGTILATPEVGGRRIQMTYRLAEQIFGPQPAGLILVGPAPGWTLDQLATEIGAYPFTQPVRLVDSAGYQSEVAHGEARFLAPLNTLKYGLLAIAFISVSSTLLLVGLRRRREAALLQALGATRAKVFTITTVEAAVASAAGAVVGAALFIAIFEAVRRAAVVNVGSATPLIFPLTDAATYAALATLAAMLAAVVPAWRSTQAAPATELRDE